MNLSALIALEDAARFPGVYAGRVTNVDDPLKSGRVRVQVPAMFVDDAPWARPCFPYGHFFVPAVDDHVWVIFEGGDPAAPVWLGVWYPSGDAPAPAGDAQPPVQRLVRTQSGHTLMLDDTDGKQTLRIEDSSGCFVELSDAKLRLQDAGGSYVELGPSLVMIHSEQPVQISAPGHAITVKAASFDVKKG